MSKYTIREQIEFENGFNMLKYFYENLICGFAESKNILNWDIFKWK